MEPGDPKENPGWKSFPNFSFRECHKYASCIMTFEGAEDLASCRSTKCSYQSFNYVRTGTNREVDNLHIWVRQNKILHLSSILRCPDGFHGDGETSCLPGEPEPHQVFCHTSLFSDNLCGSSFIQHPLPVSAWKLSENQSGPSVIQHPSLFQPENGDCRSEREACGEHAQCVYQVVMIIIIIMILKRWYWWWRSVYLSEDDDHDGDDSDENCDHENRIMI